MSDGPRDQGADRGAAADEPTTGPPAGAATTTSLGAGTPPGPAAGRPGAAPATGARSAGQRATGSTGAVSAGATPEAEARKRRRRRLYMIGISVGAALVVIALCAAGLAVLRAFFRDEAVDTRPDLRLRDTACLELETRLNRLVPPGATTSPRARATAVRDENAATRIYVSRLHDQRVSDGWRELLDSRTAYAEALDAQVKSRTPAFYVAPAPRDGVSLADQIARWSPGACAGPIHRLAAPDL